MTPSRTILASLLLAVAPTLAPAQDMNILEPVDSIEHRMVYGEFEIIDRRGSRFEGDRTSRVALSFDDGALMIVKWAPAPRFGEEFNNAPRFEVAAYEIQKLFLEESEYIVPPTVMRAFPLSWYRTLDSRTRATLRNTQSVIVALQYWLYNVTDEGFYDRDRLEADTAYARHFGNFNLLTYLIRHSDENEGNFLISADSSHPRIFSVDNGVAFSSEESDRGYYWRRLRTDRLPATSMTRLWTLTEEELHAHLGTLVEWRVLDDGTLERVEPRPPINPREGIRHRDDRIQFGLSRSEVSAVWDRIQRVIREVQEGDIVVF